MASQTDRITCSSLLSVNKDISTLVLDAVHLCVTPSSTLCNNPLLPITLQLAIAKSGDMTYSFVRPERA